MAIPAFKNGRMFVGWRQRDYKLVYYSPYGGDDADEGNLALSLFFVNPTGEEDSAMMDGEVLFLPHFAYKNCETEGRTQQKSMQLNNLVAAFNLYNENDPEAYEELMKQAEKDLGWPRWKSILTEIKRFKNSKMKAKVTKRNRKEEKKREMERNGVPAHTIAEELVSDDSGFEDEDDDTVVDLQSRRHRRQTTMPPPPKKRPNPNGNNKFGPRKKGKADTRKRGGPGRFEPEDFFMSGGIGDDDSDNVRTRAQRGGSLNSLIHDSSRDESLPYDPAPPQRFGSSPRDRESDTNSDMFITDRNAEWANITDGEIERYQHLAGHTRTEQEIRSFFNGGLDEQEGIDLAIRQSLQPEERPRGDVAKSTEGQNGESLAHGGAAGRSARNRGRSGSNASNPENIDG